MFIFKQGTFVSTFNQKILFNFYRCGNFFFAKFGDILSFKFSGISFNRQTADRRDN